MLKRNELLSMKRHWKNFQRVMLSERRQSEVPHTGWSRVYDILEKAKPIEAVKRSWVARGFGEGGMNRCSAGDF